MRRIGVFIAIAISALVLGKAAGQEAESTRENSAGIVLLPLPMTSNQGVLPVEQQQSSVTPDARAVKLMKRLRTRVDAVRRARVGLSEEERAGLNRVRTNARGDVSVSMRPELGTPRQLKARTLFQMGRALAANGEDPEVAIVWRFFEEHGDLLRIERPRDELVLVRKEPDPLGGKRIRFDQYYRGLRVWPTGVIVHLDQDGNVRVLDASYVPTPRNAIVWPVIDASEALAWARKTVGEGQPSEKPELLLWLRGSTTPRLVWRIRMRVSLMSELELLVSAADGTVYSRRERVQCENVVGSGTDALGASRVLNVWHDAGTYYLWDTSKPMFNPATGTGVILVGDALNTFTVWDWPRSNSPTSWSVADSVSAAWALSQTYDYYLSSHARNSYDGLGADLLAIVRVGTGYENAHWDAGARRMYFGDGDNFAGSIDIVAHEMTHAVITYSARLHYEGQSGALNEAYADIFGELVEGYATGSNDWLVGTALREPMRNMIDPGSLRTFLGSPYPSRMSQFLNTQQDFGGVHINSSIVNHCFYLLAEGLTDAIGSEAAGRVFYRALTAHLTKYAQFKDARIACITAAEELFGAGSNEVQCVSEAFDRVEIGIATPSPGPADYPEVVGPDSTLFLFIDSESGDYLVGRRDTNAGDGVLGISVDPNVPVSTGRLSVSGDGRFAVCITADNDVGFINIYGENTTDGMPVITPLGLTGQVYAITMDPSGDRFAFVLLDSGGSPTNQISVVDLKADSTRTFTLQAAAQDGGDIVPAPEFADAMDFTSDGRFLVYDALNSLSVGTYVSSNWSIYALDLLTEATLSVVPPFIGFDIGNPSMSQTSDGFLTFEVLDNTALQSTIYAGDLNTGALQAIGTVDGGFFAFPSYMGDDSAIVYEVPDAATSTGSTVVRQPLVGRLVPAGSPSTWVQDATRAVVYRRGVFVVPNTPPDATIDTPVADVTINEGESVSFAATGHDVNGHVPLTWKWDFSGGAPRSFFEDPGLVRFDQAGVYVVRLEAIDSEGLADPTPATRRVTVLAPPPPPPPDPPAPQAAPTGGGGCAYNPNASFDPTWVLMLVVLYASIQRRRRSSEEKR